LPASGISPDSNVARAYAIDVHVRPPVVRPSIVLRRRRGAETEPEPPAAYVPPPIVETPKPIVTAPDPPIVAAPPPIVTPRPPIVAAQPPPVARSRRVLGSAAGPLSFRPLRPSNRALTAAGSTFRGPGGETMSIIYPTGLGSPVAQNSHAPLPVPDGINDVTDFAKGATREAVLDVLVVTSLIGDGIDAFYGGAIPQRPKPTLPQSRPARMLHPLYGRRKAPTLIVRRLGVPETW
jgi:hypothetical protein